MAGTVRITGVRHHNLKGIDLEIPLNRFVVVTGPSGSGKSTLALDVLFTEAQCRYLDALGVPFGHRALGNVVEVDCIEGLPPVIALEQLPSGRLDRSSLAVLTGVAPLVKVMFSRYGTVVSACCGELLRIWTPEEMAAELLALPEATRLSVLAPVSHLLSSYSPAQLFDLLRTEGFMRIKVGGGLLLLDEIGAGEVETELSGGVWVVVDRLKARPGVRPRLLEALRLSLRLGGGIVEVEAGAPGAGEVLRFAEEAICPACRKRYPEPAPTFFTPLLNPGLGERGSEAGDGLPWTISWEGRRVQEVVSLSIADFCEQVQGFLDARSEDRLAVELARGVLERLRPAVQMGLGYLGLNRPLNAISGGELQLLRIGAQLSRPMPGVLYVLDEPSCGLGRRELDVVLSLIKGLVEQGGSVLAVDHSLELIEAADYVVELGPGSGDRGGEVVFAGPGEELRSSSGVTASCLLHPSMPLRRPRCVDDAAWIEVQAAGFRNLQVSGAMFPLERVVVVTGPVGSGKSSLVTEVLPGIVERRFPSLRVVAVDQAPLRGGGSSIVASYLGVFDPIRSLFARLPLSRQRGYTKATFSLAKKGGRCGYCKGKGFVDETVAYIPKVHQPCPVCRGRRFSPDVLEAKFKGYSLADILETRVDEALRIFGGFHEIRSRLELLVQVRLDYLMLGQQCDSLSGGEAQRLKLASRLAVNSRECLFILDEPTRGLHMSDVKVLMELVDSLVKAGHSVVIITNTPAVVASADWVVELGPGSGPEGGWLVRQWAPSSEDT